MDRLRIVVAGLMGSFPMAGSTLSWLQYVLGLRELGHDVLYLEDTGAWYYDPSCNLVVEDYNIPLNHIRRTMESFGLSASWAFIDHRGKQFGVTGNRLYEFLKTSDLLVHVTGAMYMKEEYLQIPKRAYVDSDPGFIHFRIAGGSKRDFEHLNRHTTHFSIGYNIGTPHCTIPTGGFKWYPTTQPIVFSLWPAAPDPPDDAPFTTVVKWEGYGPEEHDGEVLGLKDIEFQKFITIPEITNQKFEIAMAGPPPVDNLEEKGWKYRNGREISSTIEGYRNYIHSSRAEWSIAKNGYVKTRSGWFSDRSASYLASGRPVILQSTGYENWLPTNEGIFAFSTIEEAREAIESINSNYKGNARRAREIAEEFFDSKKILTNILEISLAR